MHFNTLKFSISPQLIDRSNFHGCIKDLKFLTLLSQDLNLQDLTSRGEDLASQTSFEVEGWKDVDWSEAQSSPHNVPVVLGCFKNVEKAMRLHGTGYLQAWVEGVDGRSFTDIFFSFRTRSEAGLLLFAHGAKGSFYVVEVERGRLKFLVSIDGVLSRYVHEPPLCDGVLHSVRLVIDLAFGSVPVQLMELQLFLIITYNFY